MFEYECFPSDSKFPFPKRCESWLKMVTELSGKHDIYLGHEQRLKCFMVGFLL